VDDRKGFRERSMIPEFGTPLEIARAIYLEALQQFRARDSDGTATAAINEDLSSKGRPMTNTPAPLYLVELIDLVDQLSQQ
jgi:hypothetical protein